MAKITNYVINWANTQFPIFKPILPDPHFVSSDDSMVVNLIRTVASSRKIPFVFLKYIVILALGLNSVAGLWLAFLSFSPSNVFRKDILQEYVLAKAAIMRINPYLPLPELVERIVGTPPVEILNHPTPHPPPVAIFSLPLALLTYPQAAFAWFLVEIVLVLLISYLLYTAFNNKIHWPWIGVIAILLLAWQPFIKDIVFGQMMILLLALVAGAWLALRNGKPFLGGVLLGLAISVKIMMWPVLFLLIVRKYWRAGLTALATVTLTNLVSALVIGFETVLNYYLRIGNEVFLLYRSFATNYSLWTVGWRFFTGTSSKAQFEISAPPLIDAPALAPYVSAGLPLLLFFASILLAWRMSNFDDAFAVMVAVSLLISPITWIHYFSLAILPILVVYQKLASSDFPRRETWIFMITTFILLIPDQFLRSLMKTIAITPYVEGYDIHVSGAAGMITYLPTVVLLILILLLFQLCQQKNIAPQPDHYQNCKPGDQLIELR